MTAYLVVAIHRADKRSSTLQSKTALVCRAIGDQLLHHAGDARSRVLPVKQLAQGVFQIEFQRSLSFDADTLVEIVRSNILSSGLPEHYSVNVLHCSTSDIVYGFQIAHAQDDIIPCLSREQPSGCYTIQLAFTDLTTPLISQSDAPTIAIIIFGLTLVSALIIWFPVRHTDQSAAVNGKIISIGNCLLDAEGRSISDRSGTVELSDIEAKLLTILAEEQNKLVPRERLLKEVWEDNGVFTSRSLDMFISKLRKKFSQDDSVALVNIYGKGYKLEVK